MELLSVVLAGLAGFAVGAVWYMALSKPWMAASGVKIGPNGQPAPAGGVSPMIVGLGAMVVVAGMMRHIFGMAGIDTAGKGLVAGLGLGAFMITPWLAMCYAFSGRPRMLTLIDGGYAILGSGMIGLVLTLL